MNIVFIRNMSEYVMIALSVFNLLYKTDDLNLKNIINYIVFAFYILIMAIYNKSSLIDNVGFRAFIQKNFIIDSSLIVMALLISHKKSIGVYSALCVLFIFDIFNYLIFYYTLWYFRYGYILYVLIPLITIGLSYMNCLKYNQKTLVNTIVCDALWACVNFGMLSYTYSHDSYFVISSPLFIVIFSVLFIIWVVMNRRFVIKERD